MASWTLTSSNFQRIQNRLAHVVTKSPPFTRSVPLLPSLHWLPVKFRVLIKISLSTYKTIHEKHPPYLHPMLAISLPFRSLRSNKGISVSIPMVKITQVQEHFTPVPLLFGTICRCLSIQPFQLLLSRNISKHISLTLHQHTRWPVDVTELLHQGIAVEHQFGCLTTEPGFAGDIGAAEIWLIDEFWGSTVHCICRAFAVFGNWTCSKMLINQSNFYSTNIPAVARLSESCLWPSYMIKWTRTQPQLISHFSLQNVSGGYLVQMYTQWALTFEEGADVPDCDGAEAGKLTICHFKEEERHATQYEECQVWDKKDSCKDIEHTLYHYKSIHK